MEGGPSYNGYTRAMLVRPCPTFAAVLSVESCFLRGNNRIRVKGHWWYRLASGAQVTHDEFHSILEKSFAGA